MYSCSFLAAYKKDKILLKKNIHGPLGLCSDGLTIGCYDLACIYSIMGNNEDSLNYLRKALDGGYKNWDHLSKDPDLASVRKTSKFKEIIEDYKQTENGRNIGDRR